MQARLAKLVDRGAIRSFGPDVAPEAIGCPVLAFVFLEIAQGRLEQAVAVLEDIPEVLEVHGTTGPRDLLCRVVARDNGHRPGRTARAPSPAPASAAAPTRPPSRQPPTSAVVAATAAPAEKPA